MAHSPGRSVRSSPVFIWIKWGRERYFNAVETDWWRPQVMHWILGCLSKYLSCTQSFIYNPCDLVGHSTAVLCLQMGNLRVRKALELTGGHTWASGKAETRTQDFCHFRAGGSLAYDLGKVTKFLWLWIPWWMWEVTLLPLPQTAVKIISKVCLKPVTVSEHLLS